MSNSYGFNGEFPDGAIAGLYSLHNGEFTGTFFFSIEEVDTAKEFYAEDEDYSVEMINVYAQ